MSCSRFFFPAIRFFQWDLIRAADELSRLGKIRHDSYASIILDRSLECLADSMTSEGEGERKRRIDRSIPKRCVSIEQRFLADFFVVDVSTPVVNHHGKCVASLQYQPIRNDGQNGRAMSSIEKIT